MMGETRLFETLNQLNRFLHKMMFYDEYDISDGAFKIASSSFEKCYV